MVLLLECMIKQPLGNSSVQNMSELTYQIEQGQNSIVSSNHCNFAHFIDPCRVKTEMSFPMLLLV